MKQIQQLIQFNELWHTVGAQLRDEMYNPKYQHINSLTMIDLSIIQDIDMHPLTSFKDINERLNIPKSTLTSAIKRLEEKNLVLREVSPNDKRAYALSLSITGQQAQKEHLTSEYTVFADVFKGLQEDERNQLINLFSKAIQHQEKHL